MRTSISLLIIIACFFQTKATGKHTDNSPRWGFFGHKLINRMAVFTLPPEMIGFYKKHIEYLTEHSVDPDKRRYSSSLEAPRHFIDMENYGVYPFETLPRTWAAYLVSYADVFLVTSSDDTLKILGNEIWRATSHDYQIVDDKLLHFLGVEEYKLTARVMNRFINTNISQLYFNEESHLSPDSLSILFDSLISIDKVKSVYIINNFTTHGILPYNAEQNYNRLVKAFLEKDVDKILKYSAEIGHYIGDAHVPLHTSRNYNGQLSGQEGIHAFWESRIPELFANDEFDFLVGKASNIENINAFIWKIIFDSHEGVQLLLDQEYQLKNGYATDKQFCYENRAQQVVRTQCREFAGAYNLALDGQVEERMRQSILSIGSIWYTAWLEAGQPDLNLLGDIVLNPDDKKYFDQLEADYQKGRGGLGRDHE